MVGWSVADDATRATLTVPLVAGTCTETQPAVTAVPPQCVAGLVTLGTVTPVAVAGVTYDPAGVTTVALGQPVTVTATLAASAVAWEDPLRRWLGASSRRRRRHIRRFR